jgi:hypothetical protein
MASIVSHHSAGNLKSQKDDDMYPEQDYNVPFPNMEAEYEQLAGPIPLEVDLRR